MPALIIHEPGKPSRVFILRRAVSLLGAGTLNDEAITCKGAEQHSVAVEARGDAWVAVDKSGKGILTAAARAAELALVEGTEFMVGAARVRFDAAYTHDGDDTGAKPAFAGSTAVMTRVGKGKDTDMVGMLVFRGGERKVFEIGADPAQIGSDAGNPICVPEKHVSARHARIFQRNGAYWIIDLDSTNGTLVDGVTVKEARLQDCIPVTFGKTQAVFRLKRAGQGRAAVPVFFGMAGNSAAMLEVFAAIREAAKGVAPVLVTGKTGTGKELVANAIHKLSGRVGKKPVTLNCANLPRDLAESELFGHEKGAFTGAHEPRKGAFEDADGGTLFLDEIGEMPLELQAKLLRAVEYGEVKHVGSNKTTIVSTRVVAATNRDLAAEVAAGKFREDLFYRLNVVPIALPALKDRIEDVPAIADYMLDEMSERSWSLTDKARAKLVTHEWPGNVRELHNVLAAAYARAKGGLVDAGDLKFKPASLKERLDYGREFSRAKTMEEIEREAIEDALKRHDGDKKKAAEELGIGFSTLKRKCKETRIGCGNGD